MTADDAFLRGTILNPTMHTTAGYAPIMPTYQGQISEEGLIDLVEYIKELNTNYRIQQTLNTTQVFAQPGRCHGRRRTTGRQLTGADQMPDAIPDTSTSKGMGPSPQ